MTDTPTEGMLRAGAEVAAALVRRREWYANSPEAKTKNYAGHVRRMSDPEYREQRLAQERERQRVQALDPEWCRRDRLERRARRYSITVEQLEAMQREGCGICGAATLLNGNSLHVDHDHACCQGARSCGECIRGVLCYADNIHFERFMDSPRVIAYLQRTVAGRATLERGFVFKEPKPRRRT